MTLTALLAAGVSASAQEVSTSLPLTSVGDQLMWTVGDQNLTLDVPVAGRVRLELYSPRVDQGDYRADAYYGDEQYDANAGQVTTTFTLLREDGSEVLSQVFAPGAHEWATLLDQDLPAGTYRLKAVTQGNGKNTFAVRLAGLSAAVSAERLSVNVHSRDWVPAVNVTSDGGDYVLRMYDGDGPQELEARIRDEQGRVTPLTVSGDLAYSDLPIPAQSGQYVIELRQPEGARQFSNTVGFQLTRSGQSAPIGLAKVDQTGTLRVVAELVLPGGSVPTQADVTVGKTPLRVDGQFEQRVAPDTYALSAAPVTGADVQVTPSVTVAKHGQAEATVQVRPQVKLELSSDKAALCVGDTVTLRARASTAYAGELPLDLNVDAGNLNLEGLNHLEGHFNAAQPGELLITGTATQPGALNVRASLGGWNQTQTLDLNVLPDVTSLQLQRAPLPEAQVGDELTVSLTLRNTAEQAVPYLLQDQPGAGLDALESTEFSGTLAAGESRTLSYRARVTQAGTLALNATLLSETCAGEQTVAGQVIAQAAPQPTPAPTTAPNTAPTTEAPPAPSPAPAQTRLSSLTLPFDAPSQAKEVVVAQKLPEGATLVRGSSRLDGQIIADPVQGASGTLYWVIPEPASSPATASGAAVRGVVSYDISHQAALGGLPAPALLVRLSGERSEVLEGTLDQADLNAAREISAALPLTENAGAIKFPLDGSVLRIRDRISVVVEVPTGSQDGLSVNGQPVSSDRIGETTEDGPRGVTRLTYVGVPLKPGPNVLQVGQVGSERIEVKLVGATSRLEVVPSAMIADGSSPLRVTIRALDEFGNLTAEPSLTLRSNLEPRSSDAAPGEADFQIRLEGGQGVLELQPQSGPTVLKLDILQGEKVTPFTFEVRPDQGRVGVGVASATLGLDGDLVLTDDLTWQARASYEGPLAGGKLYLAADKDGLPTDNDTLKRFAFHGDSSVASVPLQGIDPVAMAYDHPTFHAQYSQGSLPIDVLPVGEQLTALTAYSKTKVQASGFVALVPKGRVTDERLTPEGTRLLRLNNGTIAPGSETLVLLTLERGSGKELKRVTLERNSDYLLDLRTGIITLARALDRHDAELNDVLVVASYRLNNTLAQRELAYGAQVKQVGERHMVGVAAVSLDGTVTYGARAAYSNGTLRADGLLAYSGGFQASADFSTKLGDDTVQAKVRYQQSGYKGLSPLSPGLSGSVSYDARLGQRLSANVQADYHHDLASTAPKQGGSITARADYRVAPFSVGAGLKYAFGDEYGLGAVASVGYHRKPLDVDISHTQPLSGTLAPVTTLTTKYALNDKVSLGLTDTYNWKTGHTAALNLDSRLGGTNYQVAYDLPTAGGQGNRARFGVSTTLPLGEHLSAGLRGSALYNVGKQDAEVGAGADLNYKADRLSATSGSDVVYSSKGFGVVLRAGVSGQVSDAFTLTADGLVEFGAGKNGQRAALGYAYRTRNFNSLGTVRYINGSLAGGQPELSSNLAAEYRQATWAVRGGLDTRTLLSDTDSFTAQASLGGTYYLSDYFGVGAWGRAITQPASQTSQYGFGLEASVRALPGTWITAGYNPVGFAGLGNSYSKKGAYLRLDLTLDERLGGKK